MSKTVDAAIVGAGLSGLVSAYRLQRAGADVVVLEAKDRVGGRLMTSASRSGIGVDSGGSWVGLRQQAVLALLEEFGIGLVPQYADGVNLLRIAGREYRYQGEIPRLRPHEMLDLGRAMWVLDRIAKRLGAPPWTGDFAARVDERSLGAWMRRNVRTAASRLVLEMVTAASFGCRPTELSLLTFSAHVHGSGGLSDLIGVSDGALAYRIAGGAAALPARLAESLGDRVRLGHAVTGIERHADHVILTGPGRPPVRARRVIVAADPATVACIAHRPALPAGRAELQRRWQMGSGIKAHVVYRRPWWRERGLTGAAITDAGTARITFDVSPPETGEGVLTTFLGLPVSDDPALLAPEAGDRRRQRVLEDLAALFGPDVWTFEDYIEKDWTRESWQSGCLLRVPTGVLSVGRPWLTEPVGALHWAGSESSHFGEGHMDGAVRAGTRAAEEVLAELALKQLRT